MKEKRTELLQVRLSKADKARLFDLAEADGRSMSDWIVNKIRESAREDFTETIILYVTKDGKEEELEWLNITHKDWQAIFKTESELKEYLNEEIVTHEELASADSIYAKYKAKSVDYVFSLDTTWYLKH